MTPVNGSQGVAARPFYGEFAWAYDYLIERPVAGECAGMVAALARRGIGPGASLLDAGCGTGRYAVELARRGFVVTGIDRSPALLAVALRRPVDASARVRFGSGDLLALPAGAGFDAIVCRGVLNDLVETAERAAVFAAFGRALRPGGAVLFDVRDWDASVAGKTAQPVSERRAATVSGLPTMANRPAMTSSVIPSSEKRKCCSGSAKGELMTGFSMTVWGIRPTLPTVY